MIKGDSLDKTKIKPKLTNEHVDYINNMYQFYDDDSISTESLLEMLCENIMTQYNLRYITAFDLLMEALQHEAD